MRCSTSSSSSPQAASSAPAAPVPPEIAKNRRRETGSRAMRLNALLSLRGREVLILGSRVLDPESSSLSAFPLPYAGPAGADQPFRPKRDER